MHIDVRIHLVTDGCFGGLVNMRACARFEEPFEFRSLSLKTDRRARGRTHLLSAGMTRYRHILWF